MRLEIRLRMTLFSFAFDSHSKMTTTLSLNELDCFSVILAMSLDNRSVRLFRRFFILISQGS